MKKDIEKKVNMQLDKFDARIKYMLGTKKGITLTSQIAIIFMVFIIYILADYIKLGGSMSFITDFWYWVSTSIGLILVCTLMIVIRQMRKDKKCSESKTIADNLVAIGRVRKVILNNNYSDEFQKELEEVNNENKYKTYLNKYTKKIRFLPYRFLLSKKKKDKKQLQYEAALKVSKEEVIKMNFYYSQITQTGCFAGIDGYIAVDNEFDIKTHESKNVFEMTGKKALIVYLLTAFSGTLIVDFMFGGWIAIWSTLLKLFGLLIATISALRTADNFVDYNVEQALDNRVRIILNFVNKHEDIKAKVLDLISREKEEIEKIKEIVKNSIEEEIKG